MALASPSSSRYSSCIALLPVCGACDSLCEDEWQHRQLLRFRLCYEDFSGSGRIATPALLGAMLRAAEKISDLIFSPGRPPQVQVYGQMIPGANTGNDRYYPLTIPGTSRPILSAITSRRSTRFVNKDPAIFLTDCPDWRDFASIYSFSVAAAQS